MAEPTEEEPRDSRQLWIAVIIGVLALAATRVFLHWGVIPAIIGGFAIGVIWWSINRSFSGGK